MPEKAFVDGVELNLSEPVYFTQEWVGQEEVLQQILACWSVLDPSDIPLCPRIVGKPGVGKTTLAISAARKMKQDVYIFTGELDIQTHPREALAVRGECARLKKKNCSVFIVPELGHGFSIPRGPRHHRFLDATIGPIDPKFQNILYNFLSIKHIFNNSISIFHIILIYFQNKFLSIFY